MVTAETAVLLPLLAVFTVALIWAISLGITQVRCLDAAREAARATARGDDPADVRELAQRAAPDGAAVTLLRNGDSVTAVVTVTADAGIPLLGDLTSVDLSARAVAAMEVDGAD